MTPLTKIENGIIAGDWNLVCEGFNKLTGKKLIAPVVPILKKDIELPEQKFDSKTATKRELYNWIKNKYDIAPIKTFTIEELREMYTVYSVNEEPLEDVVVEIQELADGAAFLDGFRFHSGRKKLLPIDTQKVIATLEPMLHGDDGPDKEIQKRDPPKKISMKCLKCNKSFSNYAYLGVDSGGEVKALCPVCSEII